MSLPPVATAQTTHTNDRREGRAVLLGSRETETVVSESELPEPLDLELSLLTERVSSNVPSYALYVYLIGFLLHLQTLGQPYHSDMARRIAGRQKRRARYSAVNAKGVSRFPSLLSPYHALCTPVSQP